MGEYEYEVALEYRMLVTVEANSEEEAHMKAYEIMRDADVTGADADKYGTWFFNWAGLYRADNDTLLDESFA